MTAPVREMPAAHDAPAQLRVDVLTTTQELDAITPQWAQLCDQDLNATPFQRPEWLLPWWKHVGEGTLYTLTLSDTSNRLLGLLPLYIYTQPISGERHLLLLGAGTSDYLDAVFAREDLVEAALEFVASQHGHWDRAIFHQLRESSPLLRYARSSGWPISEAEPCSAVPVHDWAHLPSKLRLNIGRYRRRAASQGTLHFRVAASIGEALASFQDLLALHAKRWHGRGERGVLASSAVQAHHRETIPGLLQAGLLRMASLELDTRVIAVLYAFASSSSGSAAASASRMCCYLIGFDTDFADISPGSLILASLFDLCKAERIAHLDLLRGGEAYKQLWGAVSEMTYRFELDRS